MLLTNAIEAFLLISSTERRLAPRTVRLYTSALSVLADYAASKGRTKVADLTPSLVRAAAASAMDPSNHAPNWKGGEAMAVIVVAATRTMCRRLHEEYPELSLPDLSVIHAPRIPQRIQPRLEPGEFAKLEAAIKMRLLRDRVPRFLIARDLALLEVLANTGLRAAECCGLDVEDVDIEEGAIRVRNAKGGRWRILTIFDPDERDGGEVVRALTDYLHYREHTFAAVSEALWLTPRGNRLNPAALRRVLSVLCDEAGIDGSRPPHAFRRAHFTEQYRQQPLSLPVLVQRMGWVNNGMAATYTRGVDVELARRIQLPLVSKKWREESRPVVGGHALTQWGSRASLPDQRKTGTTADPPARRRRSAEL